MVRTASLLLAVYFSSFSSWTLELESLDLILMRMARRDQAITDGDYEVRIDFPFCRLLFDSHIYSVLQETHLIVLLDDDLEIAAGVLLEYWGHPNVVLVTYLCVSDKHRRRGLASVLIDHVVTLGDQCAKRWFVPFEFRDCRLVPSCLCVIFLMDYLAIRLVVFLLTSS